MKLTNKIDVLGSKELVERWIGEAYQRNGIRWRRSQRLPFACPATVSRGGLEVRAMCRDFSAEGIGLIQADCPPKLGLQAITIWVRNRVVHLPVEILWAHRIGKHWWASGGPLAVTTWEKLRLVVEGYMGHVHERRKEKRYAYCRSFMTKLDQVGEADEFTDAYERTFVSLDISQGGIRAVSEEPLAPAGSFVRTYREGDMEQCGVQGVVRSNTELKNGFCCTAIQFC